MKKILSCEFNGGEWNGYKVETMAIADLWPSVPIARKLKGKEFYGPILEDIKENGLKFPLLIVRSTREELYTQKKRYKVGMNPLPFDPDNCDLEAITNTVWGGSNRYAIAKELGYTHIDVIVLDDFSKARGMQKIHRAPYQGKFY